MGFELANPQNDWNTVTLRYHVSASFEAARQIHTLAPTHRCANLHGHSFLATLHSLPPQPAYPGGELEGLQTQWNALVAQLDYQHLNTHISTPTDLELARWLLAQCHARELAEVESIALQSTPQSGVEVAADGTVRIWRRYAFHSAHRLPHVPYGHKCGNMHGHSFEAILHSQWSASEAESTTAESTAAYAMLDATWAPLQAELHFACLNDLPGLGNPTSEVLSSWIWARLQPSLPTLCRVTVFETGSCGAEFDGSHYKIWKDLTLDSAVRFKSAPPGNPRRQLHGTTYRLRLHLSAPLDAVMGWTVDFGDVKDLFTPIFKLVDHKPLHEIPDLADCDTAHIAAWILEKGQDRLPELCAVELEQTPGCGVVCGSSR